MPRQVSNNTSLNTGGSSMCSKRNGKIMKIVPVAVSVFVAVGGLSAVNTPPVEAQETIEVAKAVMQDNGKLKIVTDTIAESQLESFENTSNPKVVAADNVNPVTVLNDPYLNSQWALTAIGAGAVDASGVTIAVVDTGVESTHEDLSNVVLEGKDFVNGTTGTITDPQGHGTHVSGIIAGEPGNAKGISGVVKNAKILPVRVLAADGSGSDADVAAGIMWAADNEADVINLSLGSTEQSTVLDAAVDYAVAKKTVVVAAAGNDGMWGSPTMWPAAHPDAIAVASTDQTGQRSYFSNEGSYVDIAAPGSLIMSTWLNSSYQYLSGTSMATPHVAAAAGIVKHLHPEYTTAQVKSTLEKNAVDKGAPGWDPQYGWGLLNLSFNNPPGDDTSVPPDDDVTKPPTETVHRGGKVTNLKLVRKWRVKKTFVTAKWDPYEGVGVYKIQAVSATKSRIYSTHNTKLKMRVTTNPWVFRVCAYHDMQLQACSAIKNA